ncbi:hypothetical protein [Butyricimonas synergistica]|uniref:hypothetical protein n=1 Tax=Butyricimonas synergistica TaxID=544644 RepID=UPI0003649774|nr:hypothetical protein [Butyricimonas synergistica]
MKLHEAIEKVLKDENHPMTAAEITEKIKRCIYHNILRAGIFFVFSFWMLSCCDSGVPKIELTRFEDISTERQVSIRKSVMNLFNEGYEPEDFVIWDNWNGISIIFNDTQNVRKIRGGERTYQRKKKVKRNLDEVAIVDLSTSEKVEEYVKQGVNPKDLFFAKEYVEDLFPEWEPKDNLERYYKERVENQEKIKYLALVEKYEKLYDSYRRSKSILPLSIIGFLSLVIIGLIIKAFVNKNK